MNKWEWRLKREGLAPSKGRDPRTTPFNEHINPTHGLVSPVYALSPSGDYLQDDERQRRARVALKCLIKKHGHAEVEHTLTRSGVAKSDEPVRAGLLLLLRQLPPE